MAVDLFANAANTTLAAGISAGAVTLTVASSTPFPAVTTAAATQFRVIIDSELFIVTNVTGTTWTVTPGAEGTTQAAHAINAPVTAIATAGALTTKGGLNPAFVFGDGPEGDVTFASNGDILPGDHYYRNLTINAGVTVRSQVGRIFVSGTFTLNGVLTGGAINPGSGSSGGAQFAQNIIATGGFGANGGTGAGTQASGASAGSVTYGTPGVGDGGGGGASGATAGGAARTQQATGALDGGAYVLHGPIAIIAPWAVQATTAKVGGGLGGGSGAGDGTNSGGGGGSGGALLIIVANTLAGSGTLRTQGGAGAAGVGGNAGGGGGAGGGTIFIATRSPSLPWTTSLAGGLGGAGAGTGTAGTAGAAGALITFLGI